MFSRALIAVILGWLIPVDVIHAAETTRVQSQDSKEQPPMTQPSPSNALSQRDMQAVFDEVKTPFKYGIVLKGEEGKLIDCPNVFRRDNAWWMVYVCMNKVGYETHLAKSDDLLHWT